MECWTFASTKDMVEVEKFDLCSNSLQLATRFCYFESPCPTQWPAFHSSSNWPLVVKEQLLNDFQWIVYPLNNENTSKLDWFFVKEPKGSVKNVKSALYCLLHDRWTSVRGEEWTFRWNSLFTCQINSMSRKNSKSKCKPSESTSSFWESQLHLCTERISSFLHELLQATIKCYSQANSSSESLWEGLFTINNRGNIWSEFETTGSFCASMMTCSVHSTVN